MRWAALVLLVLAGCVAEPKPAATPPVPPPAAAPAARLEVPPLLRSCAKPPAPPPIPRTNAQVAAWAESLDQNRADCAERLRLLNEMIERTQ